MNRLILVLQRQHHLIDEHTARLALDESLRAFPTTTVCIDEPDLRDGDDVDWAGAQQAVLDAFSSKIEPAREPGSRIAYFGSTPVPLAMQLGYLVGDWEGVAIHQQHHQSKSWEWARRRHPTLRPIIEGPEPPRYRQACDVIIRVSTWPRIDAEATRRVVGEALHEVDIRLERPDRDAVEQPEDLDLVARAFGSILDDLGDRLPAATVHLFAAVPCGLAFRMGMKVSPTMHPVVRVYQRNARSTSTFEPALILQEPQAPGNRLAADEIKSAKEEINLWQEELDRLADRARSCGDGDAWTAWGSTTALRCPPWNHLPGTRGVLRVLDRWEVEVAPAIEEFELDRPKRRWLLSPGLILSMRRRHGVDSQRRAAIRLFFLHEALHHEVHKLTGGTGRNVGRLPRVLEELDYQADVWSLLQELHAQRSEDHQLQIVSALATLVHIVTETFWAFNDGNEPLQDLEIRRLNRYLIWYWQVLHLERASTIDEAVNTLAMKPTPELAGLRICLSRGRPAVALNTTGLDHLEFGIVEGVTLQRRPDGHAYPLRDMVEGFRLRSPELITRALQGVFDNVARNPPVSDTEG